MRQLIIARKDLNMSSGKLAAQCCHASMAFLSRNIKFCHGVPSIEIDEDIYDNWFNDSFTKTICAAKNLNHLLKVKQIAEELGLIEDKDFFLIKDNCLTELKPEEIDSNGIGHTLTCIGFKPLDDETAHKLSKKYQLYK